MLSQLPTCSQDVVNLTHQTNTSNTDEDGDADATLVGSDPGDPGDPNDLPPAFDPEPKATETSSRMKRKWEASIGGSPGNVAQKHKHQKTIDLSRDEEVSTESSVSFSRLMYALRSLEGQSWVNDEALRSILGRLNSDDCLVTDSCSLWSSSSKQRRLARAKHRIVVPAFINGNHWVLYTWHRDASAIEYMDPFNKPPEKDITETVLRLLQHLTELEQLPDVVPREVRQTAAWLPWICYVLMKFQGHSPDKRFRLRHHNHDQRFHRGHPSFYSAFHFHPILLSQIPILFPSDASHVTGDHAA